MSGRAILLPRPADQGRHPEVRIEEYGGTRIARRRVGKDESACRSYLMPYRAEGLNFTQEPMTGIERSRKHAYPDDLASLSTSYQASLLREEERPVTFIQIRRLRA